jgi:hypothetical protein
LPLDCEIATDTRWRSAARGCHHVGFSIAFAFDTTFSGVIALEFQAAMSYIIDKRSF